MNARVLQLSWMNEKIKIAANAAVPAAGSTTPLKRRAGSG